MSDSVSPLPDDLERLAHEIAIDMRARLPELAERWYDRMTTIAELSEFTAPQYREPALRNAVIDIGREIAGLVNGRRLPRACPPEIAASAELSVAMGYPLWASLQAYRFGHAVQWEAWSAAVERRSLEPGQRRTLLRAGSDYMFAYADQAARWMELEHTRARDERMRGDEQRRTHLVRDILDGRAGDTGGLGYRLEAWHVGVVASGAEAERLIRQLSDRLGGELLVVAADAVTQWAWLGSVAAPPTRAIQRQLATVEPPEDHRIAVGEPAHGMSGFAQTHREAQRAAVIGGRLDRAISTYADVALEDLSGADPARARRFIVRELGALADDTTRAHSLRETLVAYFAAAQTASAAARLLGVHERTVGNRLQTIERITGHPVAARRAELETSLRLHRLLREP